MDHHMRACVPDAAVQLPDPRLDELPPARWTHDEAPLAAPIVPEEHCGHVVRQYLVHVGELSARPCPLEEREADACHAKSVLVRGHEGGILLEDGAGGRIRRLPAVERRLGEDTV